MEYHIKTFGCQMNMADSGKIALIFEKLGFSPALNINEADLVIINMCSVRQSAVDRIFGVYEKIKKKKPITILTGCILKKDRQKFERIFDYVIDIKNLKNFYVLKNILKKALKIQKKPEIKCFKKTHDRGFSRSISISVPIMTGCNNFCSYCVVPYVRGREISISSKEIIREIKKLVGGGAREIWLLGQNVNSYKDGKTDFPLLLKMINKIPGKFWIRFTSSHPKDFLNKLAISMSKLDKVSPYLNLPAQSGDDEILKSMNRHYKVRDYKNIIDNLRKKIPDISISTDIIVGFPGETKKQFENTKKLFESVKYDMAYINKYSTRYGTAASKLKDNIPIKEKKRREQILTKILKKTALEKNKRFINKITEALIEASDKDDLIGKTWHYKSVRLKGPKNLVGKFVKIKIIGATPWGLKAILIK